MSRIFASSGDFAATDATSTLTDLPISMCCWVKESATSGGNYFVVVGTSGSSNNAYRLERSHPAGSLRSNCNEIDNAGASHGGLGATLSGSMGVWRLYAAVFTDHSNRTSYLDGRAGAGAGASTTSATNMVRVSGDALGSSVLTSSTLIAHVALWNVALSSSDINQLRYLFPNQVRAGNLVNYWPLTSNASPEPDYGSGNLPLTVTGTTFSTDNPNIAGTLVQQLMGAIG